jgi:hypothetical protein
MTIIDQLDDLEKKARAATPGPWDAEIGFELVEWVLGDHSVIMSGILRGPLIHRTARKFKFDDCDFIAACNPTVVLELITALREANSEIKKLKSFLDAYETGPRGLP